jgi:hypothetical protein
MAKSDLGSARLPLPAGIHRRAPDHRVRPLAVSRWIERQTGWSIKRFIKTARRYRTIEFQARRPQLTAADPIPDDLRHALDAINSRTCVH